MIKVNLNSKTTNTQICEDYNCDNCYGNLNYFNCEQITCLNRKLYFDIDCKVPIFE